MSENPQSKPGRICQIEVNECTDPANYNIDCSENAKCQDTPESFTCICNPGFTDISAHYSLLPGRKVRHYHWLWYICVMIYWSVSQQ